VNRASPSFGLLLLLAPALLACGRPAVQEAEAGVVLLETAGRISKAEARSHDFEVPAAGGVLEVIVEQQNVDVEVHILEGDSGLVVEIDGPSGREGAEIAVVRPRPGRHRVELYAPGLGAAGGYRLRVSWTDSLPSEGLLAARLLATEAAVRGRGTASEAPAEADRLFREALSRLPRRGWEGERARLHHARAAVLRRTDQTEAASRELLAAALMWQAAGDPRGEARARNELGLLAWQQGLGSEAIAAYRQALALREQAGDSYGQAQTLSNLGLVHHSGGDLRRAQDFYRNALALADGLGDPSFAAILLNNLGGAALDLGEPAEALEFFARALAIHRQAGDTEAEVRALTNTGAANRALGRFEPALESYLTALELARRSPRGRGEAPLLNNLGVVYLALSDFKRARAYFERALAAFRELKDPRGEASALNNLGQSWTGSGDSGRARQHHDSALALHRRRGDRRGEAMALDHLGRLALEQGAPDTASELLTAALALRRDVADPVREARTLRHLAEVHLARQERAKARELLDEALALQRRVGDLRGEGETLAVRARAERFAGRYEDALLSLREGLDQLEAFGAELAEPSHRARYLSTLRRAHEDHVDLLMELHRQQPWRGWERRGLEASERSHARALLSTVGRPRVGPWLSVADRARRATLLERFGAKVELRTRLLVRGQTERALEADQELDELSTAIAALDAGGSSGPGKLLDTAEIQALLEPGTLLLEFALGEKRSYLWAVATDQLSAYELPSRAVLEAPVRHLHELWSRLDPADRALERQLAEELARWLLAPVTAELAAAKRLVVVADGALHYLPFAALPHPGRTPSVPLVVSHELTTVPSASVLAAQRSRSATRPPASLTAAVFADPLFAADDARLGAEGAREAPTEVPRTLARVVASGREAEVLRGLVPSEKLFLALGATASRNQVSAPEVSQARILHFATHGLLDDARPSLSGLMLSRVDAAGRPIDGFLGLPAIHGLELRAELVVLSACRTALGEEVHGEGLLGLTHGFFLAGADRVLASLWPVQDRAATELMAHFYRAHLIEGEPAAGALAQAQRSLSRDPRWRDPLHWAAFVLQGDWR
jgi:CHAT domain-containing protein/Tfp pilus assembly protein PilF